MRFQFTLKSIRDLNILLKITSLMCINPKISFEKHGRFEMGTRKIAFLISILITGTSYGLCLWERINYKNSALRYSSSLCELQWMVLYLTISVQNGFGYKNKHWRKFIESFLNVEQFLECFNRAEKNICLSILKNEYFYYFLVNLLIFICNLYPLIYVTGEEEINNSKTYLSSLIFFHFLSNVVFIIVILLIFIKKRFSDFKSIVKNTLKNSNDFKQKDIQHFKLIYSNLSQIIDKFNSIFGRTILGHLFVTLTSILFSFQVIIKVYVKKSIFQNHADDYHILLGTIIYQIAIVVRIHHFC